VEWKKNLIISDKSPKQYLPEQEKGISSKELNKMYYWHCLPDGWQDMDYKPFLIHRRELMAKVIKDAYQELCVGRQEPGVEEALISIKDLIANFYFKAVGTATIIPHLRRVLPIN